MTKLSRFLPVLLVILSLATASVAQVSAQSNGLGITPRKDYNVPAGKNVSDTLYISNLSLNQDLQVNLRIIDFGAHNETGAPELQLKENSPQTPWSLKPFIKIQDQVRISAGKSANIPLTITIPAGQGAGSYYSAIQYQAVNTETKQQVNLAAASASLVFVTVPGQAKEQLTLRQFGAWQTNADRSTGVFKSFYLGSTPKELAYRLRNDGNVAEQASGSIVIKNMFGRVAKEIEDANPKRQLTLIGQTRRIQVCIRDSVLESKAPTSKTAEAATCDDPGLWPGRYTAQVAAFYGLNGNSTQELQGITTFWYFPWWSIIAAIVLVIVVLVLAWLIRRAFSGGSRRRYRR